MELRSTIALQVYFLVILDTILPLKTNSRWRPQRSNVPRLLKPELLKTELKSGLKNGSRKQKIQVKTNL